MEQRTLDRSRSVVMAAVYALTAALLLFAFVHRAEAATYYYVGGTNSTWERGANWSTSPKGVAGSTAPGVGDTAVLSYSGTTVLVRSAVRIGGLLLSNNWTGSLQLGTGTLTVVSTSLGGIRVGSGRLIGPTSNTGTIASAAGFTQTGGVITNFKGTFSLSGSLSIMSVSNSRSKFTATGTTIFNGATTQTYQVGQHRVNAVVTNLTVNNASSIVYSSGSGVTLSGALVVTTGIADLTRSSTAQNLIAVGGIQVNGSSTLKSGNNITLSGSLTVGASATFTSTGGTFTLNGNAPQTLALNAAGSNNRFNNLTINNSGSGQQGRVVVSGTGLNASGQLIVTAGILDLMTNSQAVAARGGIQVNGSSTLKTRSNITMSGSLTIGASATFTATGGTFTLNGNAPQTLAINSSNQRFNNVTLNNGGNSTTNNAVTVSGNAFTMSGTLTVTAGSLNLTTNSIGMGVKGNITIANTALARLLSNSALALSGSLTVSPSGVFTMTANTVTLNGSSQTLSGSLTFSTLRKRPSGADTLTFSATNTFTIASLDFSGVSAGGQLRLKSSQTGTKWIITNSATTSQVVNFLNVSDSSNTAANTYDCYDCTDSAGNLRWEFKTTPAASTATTTSGGGGGGGSRGLPYSTTPTTPAGTVKKDDMTKVKPVPTKKMTAKEKAAARKDARDARLKARKAKRGR